MRVLPASAPFYAKLLMRIRSLGTDIRAVAVMPEARETAVRYLKDSLLLPFDDVVQRVSGFTPIATPTLLVVDEHGVIKGAWVGLLRPEAESQVITGLCDVAGVGRVTCAVP
jgi:hypothetical protein